MHVPSRQLVHAVAKGKTTGVVLVVVGSRAAGGRGARHGLLVHVDHDVVRPIPEHREVVEVGRRGEAMLPKVRAGRQRQAVLSGVGKLWDVMLRHLVMHGRRVLLNRVVSNVVVVGRGNQEFHLAVRASALDALVGVLVDVGKVLDQLTVVCRLDLLSAHQRNLLGQSRELRLVVPVLVRLCKILLSKNELQGMTLLGRGEESPPSGCHVG